MQFAIKKDLLLRSLNYVQGVVEKKHFTYSFQRIASIKR